MSVTTDTRKSNALENRIAWETARIQQMLEQNPGWTDAQAILLASTDTITRCEAAQALVEIGPQAATPVVLEALRHAVSVEKDPDALLILLKATAEFTNASLSCEGLLENAAKRFRDGTPALKEQGVRYLSRIRRSQIRSSVDRNEVEETLRFFVTDPELSEDLQIKAETSLQASISSMDPLSPDLLDQKESSSLTSNQEMEMLCLYAPNRTWTGILTFPEPGTSSVINDHAIEICKLIPHEDSKSSFTISFRSTNSDCHHQLIHILALNFEYNSGTVNEIGNTVSRIVIQDILSSGKLVFGFDAKLLLSHEISTDAAWVGISAPVSMPIRLHSLINVEGNRFQVRRNQANILAVRGDVQTNSDFQESVNIDGISMILSRDAISGKLSLVTTAVEKDALSKMVVFTVALADKNQVLRPNQIWEGVHQFDALSESRHYELPLTLNDEEISSEMMQVGIAIRVI